MRLLCWAPLLFQCSANWLVPGRFGWRKGIPAWFTSRSDHEQRLAELQREINGLGLDGYLIPHNDRHGSEYTSEFDKRLEFISGFTGSAGTAVVLREGPSFLFTDGRYWEQAKKELSSSWQLIQEPANPVNLAQKLHHAKPSATIGLDPHLHSPTEVESLSRNLKAKGLNLLIVQKRLSADEQEQPYSVVTGQKNLVDLVRSHEQYHSNQTLSIRESDLIDHTIHAGRGFKDKAEALYSKIRSAGASHLFITHLPDISWLFNLRSGAIPYSRSAVGYCLLSAQKKAGASSTQTVLWLKNLSSLSKDVQSSLESQGVELRPYEEVRHMASALQKQDRVLVDKYTSYAITRVIDRDAHLITEPVNMVSELKAVKNEVEIDGMRNAHARDGLAVTAWLAWFKGLPMSKLRNMSERDIVDSLTTFRAAQHHYIDQSFPVIAGAGANSAIIHYSPQIQASGSETIGDKTILLVDSGAHYDTGTTDVTRTLSLTDTPSDREREIFTRVLMGHLALSNAIFHGRISTGAQLDMLARMPLWKVGLNYPHSTGHGVGHSLTVHESPPSIGSHANQAGALVPGMVVSNEPGAYLPGEFGIRIENLLLIKPVSQLNTTDPFYGFEDLTLVPYERSLTDLTLLSKEEVEQVNKYHRQVRAVLLQRLNELVIPDEFAEVLSREDVRNWLIRATESL